MTNPPTLSLPPLPLVSPLYPSPPPPPFKKTNKIQLTEHSLVINFLDDKPGSSGEDTDQNMTVKEE